MKVLFISLWYPNRYDDMAGLFVRKHAEAASRFADVHVLYVHPDSRCKRGYEYVKQTTDDVTEHYIYYHEKSCKFLRVIPFFTAYHIGYNHVLKEWGKPDIIHANVLLRTGFMAFFIKFCKGVPYVISEHWSRFLPQNFGYKGWLRKRLTELVVKQAKRVMPVSLNLEKAMIDNGLSYGNYEIVHNVVDDFFYKQPITSTSYDKKRLLHVSCFDERAKNVMGIVNAVKLLSEKRNDFEMIAVGTGKDFQSVKNLADSLNLSDNLLFFTGEQTPLQVKNWFYQSDVFVLFSNYETAGVVLSEALATGTPIISTPVGIAPEVVDALSGRLVEIGNVEQLAETMDWMLDHFQEFDGDDMRTKAKVFSYEKVGEQLKDIYEE